MKRILKLVLGLLLVPAFAIAQTATPTNTPFPNPFVVGLEGFNLDASTSLPRHDIGIPYWGKQGMYLYGVATETIGKGQWVFVDEANNFTLLDTTEAGIYNKRTCVATSDMTTTNKYGWAWCGAGVYKAAVVTSIPAGFPLTTTSTAGVAGAGGKGLTSCMSVVVGADLTPTTVRCGTLPVVNIPAATPTP